MSDNTVLMTLLSIVLSIFLGAQAPVAAQVSNPIQDAATRLAQTVQSLPQNFLNSQAGSDLIANGYQELVWHRLQDYREGSAWRWGDMDRASFKLFRELNPLITVIDGGGWAVAFKSEVRDLSRDPQVRSYLAELRTALENQTGVELPLDLWGFTFERAGDPQTAMRWLGVLFQDYEERAQLRLVDDPSAREDLDFVLDQIAQEDPSLSLYPPGVTQTDRAALYHYYVPAYLAAKLRGAGLDANAAYLSAMTFNTEYKLQSSRLFGFMQGAHDPSVGDKLGFLFSSWDGVDAPMSRLDLPSEMLHACLQDIYLGYLGALSGAGSDIEPISFEDFSARMYEDPRAWMRQLFAQAPPVRR